MKLFAALVFVFCIGGVISKTVKKSTENAAAIAKLDKTTEDTKSEVQPKKLKNTKLKSHAFKKHQPPAIIAIEIIDPSDNTTKSKNSKRTIQSALGYGIPSSNSYGVTDKPKLVFFKYSQHDIPPLQVNFQQDHNRGFSDQNSQDYTSHRQNSQEYNQANPLQIQKSVGFDLGSTRHVVYSKSNVGSYEPTTLFATYNKDGHVGGFTENVPQQGHNVPVILLRVYTNQLGGAVYPNLPVTHPYAGLNNINLQNMLTKFFDKHFYQKQNEQQQQNDFQAGYQQSYYPNQQDTYHQNSFQQTQYQPQSQYYSQQQLQGQDYYLNQPNQYHQQYQDDIQQYQYKQQGYNDDSLNTHENYPSNAHTRVIFHRSKANGKGDIQQPQVLPTKHNIYPQPQSYSSLQFHNSQTTQSQSYDDYGDPIQDYTLKQNQDDQGYYYPQIQQQLQDYQKQLSNYQNVQQDYQSEQDYKQDQQDYQELQEPQQNYPSAQQDYKSLQQNLANSNENGLVDTQKVPTPHNYHAHASVPKTNQKRTVKKLETIKRINTPKHDE